MASVHVGRKKEMLVYFLKSGHTKEGTAFSLKRNTGNFSIVNIIICKSSAFKPTPV